MITLALSVFATISIMNSFVPRLVSKTGVRWLLELFTCPVCLGYHVGYISFLIAGHGIWSFASAFATSFMSLVAYKVLSIVDSLELMADKKTGKMNGV